jgi:hypothetical protein
MKNLNTFTKIPQEEFKTQVLPILQEVINYPGSFLQLFKPRISFRIIDEHFGTMPDQSFFDSLKIIGASEGYNGCYYTFIDYNILPPFEICLQSDIKNQAIDCWYVTFDELKIFEKELCVFCQAFISPKGDWGIFVTRDNFLVLGCTPDLSKKLQALIPDIDKSIYRFLELYDAFEQKLNAHWDWLPVLIHHLYGEKYNGLLEKYKFHSE